MIIACGVICAANCESVVEVLTDVMPFVAVKLKHSLTPPIVRLLTMLPEIAGIPIDFILFALTLLGVALFHNQTLFVALAGVGTISLYKIVFTGFPTGPGVSGWLSQLAHEWVTLVNLFCLLMGFALLSRQ